MLIQLVKFGNVLMSRPAGGEALKALRPRLRGLQPNENIELDFAGVDVFTSSWGDEFLTPLFAEYSNRIVLLNTQNASVQETLKLLELPHQQ